MTPVVVEDEDGSALAVETRAVQVPAAWHGWRVDKALVALAPEFSRSHLQGLIETGALALDGVAQTRSSRKLRMGQSLALELRPTDESLAFVPQAMDLPILYEDAHILLINKPAGLVVHPGAGNWSGTLLNGLLAHHSLAASLPRAGIVHRLDKDTSGVMVVGKTLPAVTALTRDIAARQVQRHYLALAHGDVGSQPFSVDTPIGRDPIVRVRMAVVAVGSGGKVARTDVQRLALKAGISAVACKLHTACGRRDLRWQRRPGADQAGLARRAVAAASSRHPGGFAV
jgi:23S rRNA pseudouridine1911/1915/1917 synthase